jgi:uncharacterized small protein (DUF1192 family)
LIFQTSPKQIKTKIKERRVLLAEKKNTMAIQVFRHRELAQKIAGLTEDIAELKSKKALLLNQLNCTDDHGIDEIKQHIASIGASLETLNQQEEKYSAERDVALAQYAELQQRVVDVDTIELEDARHVIWPDKERETVQRLQAVHGKKFDSGTLAQGRKDVAEMLEESAESVSIRHKLQPFLIQEDKRGYGKD